METKDTYKPIACSYYDLFEIAGMRSIPVSLVLQNGDTVKGVIETLQSVKNEGEFGVLKSGDELRLDKIVSINGEESNGQC